MRRNNLLPNILVATVPYATICSMKDTSSCLLFDELACPVPGERFDINDSVWFVENEGFRMIGLHWDTMLYGYSVEDELTHRLVAVTLRQRGLAKQYEIAAAFKHSVETQRRWERLFISHGSEGLRAKIPPGRPRSVKSSQEQCIKRWFSEGVSNVEMAGRLGLSEATVRNVLKRLKLRKPKQQQVIGDLLPFDDDEPEADDAIESADSIAGLNSAETIEPSLPDNAAEEDTPSAVTSSGDPSEPQPAVIEVDEHFSGDAYIVRDPMDRSLDRLFAALGMISDVKPAFADIDHLPRVGVLLAIPMLVETGILKVFREVYRSIGPSFYGLRTTVVCLFVLALLRIKRPENVKEYNPQELGRLLGLDRAPEVKTIRRKLDRLAQRGEGASLVRAIADLRAKRDPDKLGVLYFDGHVKEYHGKYSTGKAFVSRRRLAAPAATDTWVNDVEGEPLFVVQSEVNEGLCKTLEPILEDCRSLLGQRRSLTVVFDRGGWSPKLFNSLIESGFHLITYRRGKSRKIARTQFEERQLIEGGKSFSYQLHDAPRVRVGRIKNKKKGERKYLWMRQVTRLRNEHYQTAVITDRQDLSPEKVLFLMFNRWTQENFFKYMKEEFELDALLQYGSEAVSDEHDRPNPEIKKIDKQLHQARAELTQAEKDVGKLIAKDEEGARGTVRGFKIANSDAMQTVQNAQEKVGKLEVRKASLPKRVSAEGMVRLKRERNLIADVIKMTAYSVEGAMRSMIEGSYVRNNHEGRTLLHAVFQTSGRIEVHESELQITLAPQSSSHRTTAVAELCAKLNQMNAKFPGTNLKIVASIEEQKPVMI